jgi:hypothetical protein
MCGNACASGQVCSGAMCVTSCGAGSHLTAVQVAAIAHACEQLSLLYSSYIDTGDYAHLPSVFTPDGVWQVQGNRSEGREAIGEYWKSRVARRKPEDGSRALVTNQRIDVVDADHATGSSYFTIFRYTVGAPSKSLAPAVFTKSSDEYVRTADGWRLKLRRIETIAELPN